MGERNICVRWGGFGWIPERGALLVELSPDVSSRLFTPFLMAAAFLGRHGTSFIYELDV